VVPAAVVVRGSNRLGRLWRLWRPWRLWQVWRLWRLWRLLRPAPDGKPKRAVGTVKILCLDARRWIVLGGFGDDLMVCGVCEQGGHLPLLAGPLLRVPPRLLLRRLGPLRLQSRGRVLALRSLPRASVRDRASRPAAPVPHPSRHPAPRSDSSHAHNLERERENWGEGAEQERENWGEGAEQETGRWAGMPLGGECR
jgi:hypothetical protein